MPSCPILLTNDGVSKLVKEYGKVIVLEDDLITSLAITDHYFDRQTLEFISEAMKQGGSAPHLDPDLRESIRVSIKPLIADLFPATKPHQET